MPQSIEERRAKDRLSKAKSLEKNREKINARQRAYWAAGGEAAKKKRRAYRAANADRIRARKRVDYRKNHAAILATQAKIRERNREKNAAYARAYYAANREQCVAKRRTYYLKHRKQVIAQITAYIAAHPEIALTRSRIRRARKLNAPLNDLTHAQWVVIQEVQNHCCAYCGKRCKGHMTQDHITHPFVKPRRSGRGYKKVAHSDGQQVCSGFFPVCSVFVDCSTSASCATLSLLCACFEADLKVSLAHGLP